MKRFHLRILLLGSALAFPGMAQAQSSQTFTDALGVHGTAGCAGCHTVHYNPNPIGFNTPALASAQFAFGDGGQYLVDFATTSAATPLSGISMCLSCHDGNIAKGSMMTNTLYEQKAGLLPPNLYGPQTIPTLLGNDGGPVGNYKNDHPVGPDATLGKVGVSQWFVISNGGLQLNTSAPNYDGTYGAFVKVYGAPSLLGNYRVVIPTGKEQDPSSAYITCITCHDPHKMTTYTASAVAPIANSTTGNYATYFFVAAPYNPGSLPKSNESSSTTQFCRQCHFDQANESDGIVNITTAF